jgi:hypothetical protein
MTKPSVPKVEPMPAKASPLAAVGRSLPARLVLLGIVALLYALFLSKVGAEYRISLNGDGPTFYAASVATFTRGVSPYQPDTLRAIVDPSVTRQVWPYLYSPPSLLAFWPLSWLSLDQALLAMLVFNQFMVIVMAWLIFKCLGLSLRRDFFTIGLLTCYLLLFAAIVHTLSYSQMGMIVVVLLLGFWLYARRGASIPAGMLLALAIALKTYPLVILGLLLISRRYRDVAATLASLAAIMIVALVALPRAVWVDWVAEVLPNGGYGRYPAGLFSPGSFDNHNLNAFFSRMFESGDGSSWLQGGPATGVALTYAVAGLLCAVSALAIWRTSRLPSTTRLSRIMLVAPPLIHLIAPFSWYHHLVHVLPSMVILALAAGAIPARSRLLYRILIGLLFLILAVPVLNQFALWAVLQVWTLAVGITLIPQATLPGDAEQPAPTTHRSHHGA